MHINSRYLQTNPSIILVQKLKNTNSATVANREKTYILTKSHLYNSTWGVSQDRETYNLNGNTRGHHMRVTHRTDSANPPFIIPTIPYCTKVSQYFYERTHFFTSWKLKNCFSSYSRNFFFVIISSIINFLHHIC